MQRSESKRSENTDYMQPEQKAGRPPGRPTCTGWCTTAVRSTEWSTDCTSKFLLRVGRLLGQPTGTSPGFCWGSVDRLVDRRVGSACLIKIRTPFLIRSRIQLRFPKTLRLSGYKLRGIASMNCNI